MRNVFGMMGTDVQAYERRKHTHMCVMCILVSVFNKFYVRRVHIKYYYVVMPVGNVQRLANTEQLIMMMMMMMRECFVVLNA